MSYLVVEGFPKRNTYAEEAIATGDYGGHLRFLAFVGENEAIRSLEIETPVVAGFEPCWMKLMEAASSVSELPGAT